MKKVYGSKSVFVVLSFFTAFLWIKSIHHFTGGPYNPLVNLGIKVFILIVFLFYFRRMLRPIWTYDDHSFEKWGLVYINSKKRYLWEDVTSVFFTRGPQTSLSVNYFVFSGGREVLAINFLSTGNHLKVLSDVVRLAKMNNSKVDIEPTILKKFERR